MRILAIHSALNSDPMFQSQVDHWRIWRPLRELAKHVDWQIDHVTGIIPKYLENKDLPEFTEPEIEEGMRNVQNYDIVFSSYYPDPTTYTLLQIAKKRHGVQYVMDVDDDMFAIHPGNPYWLKANHEHVYWMQRMIANNDWIVTPNPDLSQRFRDRRPGLPASSVITIPNFIADDYKHPGFDNGENLLIGFAGGSSHYFDLNDTGVIEAVRKIMHEHKEIHFQAIGIFTDKYLPKARNHFDVGVRGTDFIDKLFPTLNFDIALAPLTDDQFNAGKSNIKWQEYTRAGSPVIASDIGPYKSLKDGVNALLVRENTPEAWYKAIKTLVDSPKLRKILVANAQKELKHWRIEDQWVQYKQLFERVINERDTNADHRTVAGLSAGKTS